MHWTQFARRAVLATSVGVGVLALAPASSFSYAGESNSAAAPVDRVSALEKRLAEIETESLRDKARIATLEARARTPTAPTPPSPAAKPAAPTAKPASDAAAPALYGVVGARYNGLFATGPNREVTDRPDIQARLGVKGAVSNFTYNVRLALGRANTPAAGWVDAGDFGSDGTFLLDRAEVGWKHEDFLAATAGKVTNPFVTSQIVFDDDVSFNGATLAGTLRPAHWSALAGEDFAVSALSLTGGAFYLDNDEVFGDSHLLAAQQRADLKASALGGLSLEERAGFYFIGREDALARAISRGDVLEAVVGQAGRSTNVMQDALGRTAQPGTQFASRFGILHGYLAPKYDFGDGWFVKGMADYVNNRRAHGGGRRFEEGARGALMVGDASSPYSWDVAYSFTWIEPDAVLALYNFDQIGTNIREHRIEGRVGLTANLDFRLEVAGSKAEQPGARWILGVSNERAMRVRAAFTLRF